jgi:triosephosphate isomerase (TIM)
MLIAGNWKMFKGPGEARTFLAGFQAPDGVDVVFCPPYVSLGAAAETGHAIYAQNVHWEPSGAYTGEISPEMLLELGVQGALVGHSERRQLFGETDDGVARKAEAAFRHGLVPIVCVGETLAERESGRTMEVTQRQTERALRGLTGDQVARLVVAYEPVWAIGTGRTATPDQAQEVHAYLRRLVDRSHGEAAANALRILYGGSVKPDNIGSLMAQADIDGALVGGASLIAASFLKIVHYPPA